MRVGHNDCFSSSLSTLFVVSLDSRGKGRGCSGEVIVDDKRYRYC